MAKSLGVLVLLISLSWAAKPNVTDPKAESINLVEPDPIEDDDDKAGHVLFEQAVESHPLEVAESTSRSHQAIPIEAASEDFEHRQPPPYYSQRPSDGGPKSPSFHRSGTTGHHYQGMSAPPSPSGDFYDYYHPQRMHHRPTLTDLTPDEASTVNTPEQLLEYCCQFPACYDPLYELCIDTCRKCETVYPVTSWLPCPPLLNIPDCTSNSLSSQGRLPLACYPDIGPFANILPVSAIMKAPTFYQTSGRHSSGSVGGLSTSEMSPSQNEQWYRKNMQKRNKKQCNHRIGICLSEKLSDNSNVFHGVEPAFQERHHND
eukprot:maker-scaffold420_size176246-snap-gene-0.29 protein:Tk05642 transcript:maker-scaffold420_size176246-snap-gene-0.29-mRNA-1 annotation:"aconitate hydratase"